MKKIIIKTTRRTATKAEQKAERTELGRVDRSPILIVIHILGMLGFAAVASMMMQLDSFITNMMYGFIVVFSLILWWLFFYRKKLFSYLSTALFALLGLVTIFQAIPIIRLLSQYSIYEITFEDLGIHWISYLTIFVMIVYTIFALEFVTRTHSLLFLMSVAVIILCPVLGLDVGIVPILMILIFQFAFVIVNMTDPRNGKNIMRMKKNAKSKALSCLCLTIVILLVVLPAMQLENHYQENLFTAVTDTDSYLKDTMAKITGMSDDNIDGGKISRGNLNQTGKVLFYAITDNPPNRIFYLSDFHGGDYVNGNWSEDAVNQRSVLGNINEDSAMRMPWLSQNENPISYLYFFGGNTDNINTLVIRDMGSNHVYIPYYAQSSRGDLSGLGAYYQNQFYHINDINMGSVFKKYPQSEEFVNRYINLANYEYTKLPEKGNERLRALCDSEQLTSLNEITTFILYSLQTHAVYDTKPGTTPYNQDVIDYFMFDNNKGYCVHFASTAVLMYRMFGIPARYVSGAALTPDAFRNIGSYQNMGDNYLAEVKDYSAHAWVEIFLKDYGWVPVDVTPSLNGTISATYPGYDEQTMREIMDKHGWKFRSASTSPKEVTAQVSKTEVEVDYSPFIWFGVAGALVIVATAVWVRYALMNRKRKTGNCRFLFGHMIKMLHFCKILTDYNGSETDFAEELHRAVWTVNKDDIQQVIDILLKINYAEYKETAEDKAMVYAFYMDLSNDLYRKINPLKKFLFKWIRCF